MEDKIINKIIDVVKKYLKEEGMTSSAIPTNNVSSGKIAGTPESDFPNPPNPPVYKGKKKKFIFLGPKSRTMWIRNLKQK